jgi:hypothetical protein
MADSSAQIDKLKQFVAFSTMKLLLTGQMAAFGARDASPTNTRDMPE